MVGMGMIFDETYRPLFERLHVEGLYRRSFGYVDVPLAATASRTGSRTEIAGIGRTIAHRWAPCAMVGPWRVGNS